MLDRLKNELGASKEARNEQVKQAALETVKNNMDILDEFILHLPADATAKEKLDKIFTEFQNFSNDMQDDPRSRARIGIRRNYDLQEGEDPGVFLQAQAENPHTLGIDTLNINIWGGTNAVNTETVMRNMSDNEAAYRRGQHHTVRTENIADTATIVAINLNDDQGNVFNTRFICDANGRFVVESLMNTDDPNSKEVRVSAELPRDVARDLYRDKVSPTYKKLMTLRDQGKK